jgi:hypothetical protein
MQLRAASVLTALLVVTSAAGLASAHPGGERRAEGRQDDPLVSTFQNVSRATAWTRTDVRRFDFDTFHPQGMEVTEDRIFLSSVEITEPTVRYPEPVDGYDRTPGKGVGHLFVTDRSGRLLRDIELGEGHRYHPGGIDLDGRYLWVPVAEYRPDSSAIVYRIDTRTLEVRKMFEVDDHVGGVVLDRSRHLVVGQSWGSRRFYEWTTDGRQRGRWLNDSHLLDYQDCEYVERAKALCSGVTGLPAQPGASKGYELGGFALLDLRGRTIMHEVPTQLWSTAGHVATRNPTDIDAEGSHLTMYAAPDDSGEGNGTELLTYEAEVTPLR